MEGGEFVDGTGYLKRLRSGSYRLPGKEGQYV